MPYGINMNASQVEAARLEYPKILTHQSIYRFSGLINGAGSTELFLDGLANKRLQIPANCTAVVVYDLAAFEYATLTGAPVSGVVALGGKFPVSTGGGNIAAIAGPVAPSLSPAAQVVATVTPAVSVPLSAITFTVNTTGATTTKSVEIIAYVVIANRAPVIAGLS